MANRNKNQHNRPIPPEIRLIGTILIVVLPTPLLAYMWFAYGGGFTLGGEPTNQEKTLGNILGPLALIAPIVSVYSAIIFYRHIGKSNRKVISRLPAAEKKAIVHRKSRRYMMYLVIAGILVGMLSINQMWPSVKSSYLTAKREADLQKAIDRGCNTYYLQDLKAEDKVLRIHMTIVTQWDYDYFTDTIRPLEMAINQSFEKCLEESITPTDQRELINAYRLRSESRAHELLEENPFNLSQDEIEKIKQAEQENHR